MLRQERAAGTKLGVEAEKLTANGHLLPDETIVSLVEGWLRDNGDTFNFDGFPRTVGQAEALEKLLLARGTPLQAAISLEVDFETIAGRVSRRLVCSACGGMVSIGLHVSDETCACPRCGGSLARRSDDNLPTLEKRMEEFRSKTEPVILFYADRNLLQRVNAARPPSEVFQSISEILE